MSPEAAAPIFNEAVLAQLACPACHGNLRAEPASLVCFNCDRIYPVIDGIPVLIADRALRSGVQG